MVDLTTVDVEGRFSLADGQDPINTSARFTLSEDDNDTAQGFTVLQDAVSFDLDADGAFSGGLWPNESGERETYYRLDVVTRNAGAADTVNYIGRMIVLDEVGPQNVDQMLADFDDALGEDWGLITEAVTNYADYGAL